VASVDLISHNCALEEEKHLAAENAKPKQEIVTMKSNVQSLNDGQLHMYAGVERKVFNSLLAWLQPVINL